MPFLVGGQGREGQFGFEVGRPLVEQRLIAGRADVLDHPPGQPEQVVRGMSPGDEPGPAVLEPVEPVDDVPLEELLRAVQEDLLARASDGSIQIRLTESCNWSRKPNAPLAW